MKLPKVDFVKAGEIRGQVYDNDEMDIFRRVLAPGPDGIMQETLPDKPLYTGLKCNIDYNATDNPNPNSVDTNPIILSLEIFFSPELDVRQGDLITARKMRKGEVLNTFRGTAGLPQFRQGRMSVLIAIRGTFAG